jgi:hypothetical protein
MFPFRPCSLPWREGEKSTIYPSHLLSQETLFQHYSFATSLFIRKEENMPLKVLVEKR